MIRVIDGIVFEVKRGEGLELVGRELGLHREAVVQRPLVMEELDAPETILQWWRERVLRDKTAQEKRDAAERNRARIARRRKTDARRRCKALGCDDLLTGTYRFNQCDLALAWGHWEEFVRRVRRIWPGFVAVVAWEPQKRGAWHWHAATQRVPASFSVGGVRVKSYNALRAIWRGVVGELGGTVNRSNFVRHKQRSPARIASYIAKYMHKASLLAETVGHRLWSSSRCDVPRPVRLRFAGESVADLVDLAHNFISGGLRELCSAWVAPWGDTVYLASEPAPS